MAGETYRPPSGWDIQYDKKRGYVGRVEEGEAEWLAMIFRAASDLTQHEVFELSFSGYRKIESVKFWRRQELRRKGLIKNRCETFLAKSVRLMLYGRGMWSSEPYAQLREAYLPPQFRHNPLKDVKVMTAHAIGVA